MPPIAAAPLSPASTVGEWLDHPVGGPTVARLLAEQGHDAAVLEALRELTMTDIAGMSGGLVTVALLEGIAAQVNEVAANGGGSDAVTIPDLTGPAGGGAVVRPDWQERIVPGRFTGQTVVVTGAGSGIGRATASRIAREGGRVVAVDLVAERLDEVVAGHQGLEVIPVRADITSADGVAAILAAAGERVDGLANVAGVMDDMTPLHEVTDELWDRVLAVNVTAMFRLTRAVLTAMLEAGRGAIVNVASEASLRGSAAGAAYTTSKHAVVGLTRSAAFMYADRGIRVNAVAPGPVATRITTTFGSDLGRERLVPFLATLPPPAAPEHLAASIAFLLSDDAVNLTGVLLPSDRGWSVQ